MLKFLSYFSTPTHARYENIFSCLNGDNISRFNFPDIFQRRFLTKSKGKLTFLRNLVIAMSCG